MYEMLQMSYSTTVNSNSLMIIQLHAYLYISLYELK